MDLLIMIISPHTKIRLFFIFCFLILLNIQCKDEENDYFPRVEVDLQIHIQPELATLGILESKVFDGYGYGGVIIFKRDENEYYAYDRACTYDVPKVCKLEIESSSDLTLTCPCCSSEFILTNGDISEGPANRPLKRYNTYVQGNYLYVRN